MKIETREEALRSKLKLAEANIAELQKLAQEYERLRSKLKGAKGADRREILVELVTLATYINAGQ